MDKKFDNDLFEYIQEKKYNEYVSYVHEYSSKHLKSNLIATIIKILIVIFIIISTTYTTYKLINFFSNKPQIKLTS